MQCRYRDVAAVRRECRLWPQICVVDGPQPPVLCDETAQLINQDSAARP